jgi:hypothetical protein
VSAATLEATKMYGYEMELRARELTVERRREAEQERLAGAVRGTARRELRFAFPIEIAFAFARIGHLAALTNRRADCPEGDASWTA